MRSSSLRKCMYTYVWAQYPMTHFYNSCQECSMLKINTFYCCTFWVMCFIKRRPRVDHVVHSHVLKALCPILFSPFNMTRLGPQGNVVHYPMIIWQFDLKCRIFGEVFCKSYFNVKMSFAYTMKISISMKEHYKYEVCEQCHTICKHLLVPWPMWRRSMLTILCASCFVWRRGHQHQKLLNI